jgi:hypothetical protein
MRDTVARDRSLMKEDVAMIHPGVFQARTLGRDRE